MTDHSIGAVRRQQLADATGLVIAAVRHSAAGNRGTPPAVTSASEHALVLAFGVAAGIIEERWTRDAAEIDMTLDEYLTVLGASNATLT